MGRIKHSREENLTKQVEAGKFNKLLKPTTTQDNQERRKAWRECYNSFIWRCLEMTKSNHRKETRDTFKEIFNGNIATGLMDVMKAWQRVAAIGSDPVANENPSE